MSVFSHTCIVNVLVIQFFCLLNHTPRSPNNLLAPTLAVYFLLLVICIVRYLDRISRVAPLSAYCCLRWYPVPCLHSPRVFFGRLRWLPYSATIVKYQFPGLQNSLWSSEWSEVALIPYLNALWILYRTIRVSRRVQYAPCSSPLLMSVAIPWSRMRGHPRRHTPVSQPRRMSDWCIFLCCSPSPRDGVPSRWFLIVSEALLLHGSARTTDKQRC